LFGLKILRRLGTALR